MKTINYQAFADIINPLFVHALRQAVPDGFKGEVADRCLIKPASKHRPEASLVIYLPKGHSARLVVDCWSPQMLGRGFKPDAGGNIKIDVDFDLGNKRTLAEAEQLQKDLTLILATAEIVKKNFEDILVDE